MSSSDWASSALSLSCSVLNSCSAWISVGWCCCSMFPATSRSDLTCLTLSCISVCLLWVLSEVECVLKSPGFEGQFLLMDVCLS